MSQSRASQRTASAEKNTTNQVSALSTASSINSTHHETMLSNIRVRFNKQQPEQSTETTSSSSLSSTLKLSPLAVTSLPSTSWTTAFDHSSSSVMILSDSIAREIPLSPTIQATKSRCVRVFRSLMSLLGAIGGIYAIYHTIDRYFMQQEERIEVLVLRRS